MNTVQLETILKHILGQDFCGVYAADQLPGQIVHRPCYIVANTDDSHQAGEHWVGIVCLEDEKCIFFDSYGYGPDFNYYPASFMRFLTSVSNEIQYNTRQVQHPLASTCGPHVIYFFAQKKMGLSLPEIMRKYSNDLKKNDSLVSKYAKKYVSRVSTRRHTYRTACRQKACTLKLFNDCHTNV